MNIDRVYVGGWFQRTALHLSEFYDFLKGDDTPLELSGEKLAELRKKLNIETAEMAFDGLQYINLKTTQDISINIFEDGLITLTKDGDEDPEALVQELTEFYENKLSPAFSYLFSLGAPVPKELANIKTVYPYFFVLNKASKEDVDALWKAFDEEEYFHINEKTFEIYRGRKLYIINRKGEGLANVHEFIGEQIFLREFRGQLHRYLNLHRIIWERIAEVKERGEIKGHEIGGFKTKIEEYKKTITLIDTRIDQMSSYIHTRESIAKSDPRLKHFQDIIEYRYETLSDTLSYVKDIWTMTMRYVDSALKLFSELQAQSTNASVKNLTVVTSMGVGATLLGLFTTDSAPSFTLFGITYFFILAAVGYAANRIISYIYRRRDYRVSDTDINTDIK